MNSGKFLLGVLILYVIVGLSLIGIQIKECFTDTAISKEYNCVIEGDFALHRTTIYGYLDNPFLRAIEVDTVYVYGIHNENVEYIKDSVCLQDYLSEFVCIN